MAILLKSSPPLSYTTYADTCSEKISFDFDKAPEPAHPTQGVNPKLLERAFVGELSHRKTFYRRGVKKFAYYGSSLIVGENRAEDVDIVVLLDDYSEIEDLRTKFPQMYRMPSSVENRDGRAFEAWRMGNLNVAFTTSKDHYEKTMRAQAIAQGLSLEDKGQRVFIFEYVFDGPTKEFTDADFAQVVSGSKSLDEFCPKEETFREPIF